VDHVGGVDAGHQRLPGRQPDLVGGDEGDVAVAVAVAHLPPPLVAGYLDLHGIGIRLRQNAGRGKRVDQQCRQRDGGKDHAADHDQPAAAEKIASGLPDQGEGRERHHRHKDRRGATGQDPADRRKSLGVRPVRVQCRLNALAAAQQQHRRAAGPSRAMTGQRGCRRPVVRAS
jgi:hypothetical protein